ncbi:TorD/DmsD family molecular chaperone [Desulfosporosinus youngiae]|uniref:Putative component of anaerobic dehydrogenase n=1 Tax=Desulfosporosinus youngiae DSM 17734 TaxID=768710 RepID=H5Y305_9FIRM|nr:molecular chaperone TorD family protein [Desulfosporosinus youngiae]EHQ88562.1 putative component of anaerobic dehydrogenase [Desulfosporosinus youngiae DSM 17734]
MIDNNEELSLLEVRELIYSILGSVFLTPPSIDQVDIILEEKLFESFPLELDAEVFRQGLDQLCQWAANITESNKNEVLTELNDDFNTLFVGPHKLKAPPWESVYRSEEKLTFDAITLEVREFYRRHGLEVAKKNIEPDDHFGAELEFMAELIGRQYKALELKHYEEAKLLMDDQIEFLSEHLVKWAFEFTQDVISNARTDYFGGLARLASAYIQWDFERLKTS